jgi:hypothetical protein
MALNLRRMSKISMLVGGALVVAAMIFVVAASTSGTAGVSAQASPAARTATPVGPVATATVVRTATPAATAPAAARTATPAAAPGKLPANGDSTTFPAVLIALLGAGLIGLGLTARYTIGKSRA